MLFATVVLSPNYIIQIKRDERATNIFFSILFLHELPALMMRKARHCLKLEVRCIDLPINHNNFCSNEIEYDNADVGSVSAS